MVKKVKKLKIRSTKKTKPAPEPVSPLVFGRIHVHTFRQLRAFMARVTKMILNGELPPEVSKAAVPWVDRILICNHSLLLQSKIDEIRKAMNLPEPDEEEPDPLEIENDPEPGNPADEEVNEDG